MNLQYKLQILDVLLIDKCVVVRLGCPNLKVLIYELWSDLS